MIERVDYWGALRRGWRLLLALAILFAVVAVLVPVPAPKVSKPPVSHVPWKVGSFLAVIPPYGIGPAGVNTKTVLFWANSFYVRQAAIQAAGQAKSAGQLQPTMKGSVVNLATVETGKSGPTGKKTTGKAAVSKNGSEYV